MKTLFLFICCCLCGVTQAAAQLPDDKRDNIWYFGYGSNTNPVYSNFGGSVIDFNQSPFIMSYQYRSLNFDYTNASICDAEGQMLFYTNGILVMDSTHQKMLGSDTLSPCYYRRNHSPLGLSVIQGAIILPRPNSDRLYYIIHQKIDFNNLGGSFYGNKIEYSIVDMAQNNGRGRMIVANQTLTVDSTQVGQIAATRHANGRDWWIVVPGLHGKSDVLLLSPQGLVLHHRETMGHYNLTTSAGQAVFSPDGTHYAKYHGEYTYNPYYTETWRFDRCNGTFYNYNIIYTPSANVLRIGAAISPDSRFLYVARTLQVFQYDLSTNPPSFVDTVAVWDGYQHYINSQVSVPTYFGAMQLAPNGKIYLASNAVPELHVINHPDSMDVACDLDQHSITLPTYNAYGIPNFPYFKLGALLGSSCDTLNPQFAISAIPVDISCSGLQDGSISLQVQSTTPCIYRWQDGVSTANRSGLSAGVYSVTVMDYYRHERSLSVTIHEPSALLATATLSSVPLCYGQLAELNLSASGGTPPYTGAGAYWRPAGTSVLSASDAMGCIASDTVQIMSPSALQQQLAYAPIACHGGSTTLSISAQGGTAPYSGTDTLSLTAGTYPILISDANGCQVHDTLELTEPLPLQSQLTYAPIACHGGSTLLIIGAQGGTAPYSGTNTLNLTAGTYPIFISDANACQVHDTLELTEPLPLQSQLTYAPIACHGDSTMVSIQLSGGTAPYSYSPAPDVQGYWLVPSGTWHLHISDQGACTLDDSLVITTPASLALSLSAIAADTLLSNGQISINASGGLLPYVFAWSPAINDPTQVSGGLYELTLSDANGCEISASVVVPVINGVEQVEMLEAAYMLYPNPSNGLISLNKPSSSQVRVLQVYNALGQMVLSAELSNTNDEAHFNITSLPAGIYVLRIQDTAQQLLFTQKLIKE